MAQVYDEAVIPFVDLTKVQRDLTIDDLEVRRDRQGHRTLIARALTYGVPYDVSDDGGVNFYEEVWRAGVFDRSLAQRGSKERIPLLLTHNRQGDIPGSVIGAEPDKDGFVFRAKLYADMADGIIDRIEDGVLSGISVGARPLTNRPIKRGIERIEAALHEISLTPFAQMGDGRVLAVRAHIDTMDETVKIDETVDDDSGEAEALAEAQAFLAELPEMPGME